MVKVIKCLVLTLLSLITVSCSQSEQHEVYEPTNVSLEGSWVYPEGCIRFNKDGSFEQIDTIPIIGTYVSSLNNDSIHITEAVNANTGEFYTHHNKEDWYMVFTPLDSVTIKVTKGFPIRDSTTLKKNKLVTYDSKS